MTSVEPILAQAAPAGEPLAPAGSAPSDAKVFSLTDLEYLLGPIALYPDPLVVLILPASIFPLQVVRADRWVAANSEALRANNFPGADSQAWDQSMIALTRFPDVLRLLADHLDLTESLGAAFAQQPQDVAHAIQLLRAQAQKVGNLQTTPQQIVTNREEGGAQVIYIAPATPDRIYVPVYDPGIVFASALATGLIFGAGVLVGSYWNSRWGWNNRNWTTVWINQPVWRPGRLGGPPPGAWRQDRPVPRPDRPGLRPDRPGVRPDFPCRPPTRPDRPVVRPDRPGMRPDRPVVRPDRPIVHPDRPGARPSRPAVRPDRPQVRPAPPAARPNRPQARPNVTGPNRPQTKPNRGQIRQNRPSISP